MMYKSVIGLREDRWNSMQKNFGTSSEISLYTLSLLSLHSIVASLSIYSVQRDSPSLSMMIIFLLLPKRIEEVEVEQTSKCKALVASLKRC